MLEKVNLAVVYKVYIFFLLEYRDKFWQFKSTSLHFETKIKKISCSDIFIKSTVKQQATLKRLVGNSAKLEQCNNIQLLTLI